MPGTRHRRGHALLGARGRILPRRLGAHRRLGSQRYRAVDKVLCTPSLLLRPAGSARRAEPGLQSPKAHPGRPQGRGAPVFTSFDVIVPEIVALGLTQNVNRGLIPNWNSMVLSEHMGRLGSDEAWRTTEVPQVSKSNLFRFRKEHAKCRREQSRN